MTFNEYLLAVLAYFRLGGVTHEQSFMRVLKEERVDLYNKINGSVGYDPLLDARNTGAFVLWLFEHWEVQER